MHFSLTALHEVISRCFRQDLKIMLAKSHLVNIICKKAAYSNYKSQSVGYLYIELVGKYKFMCDT